MDYTYQEELQMQQAWASHLCQKTFNKHCAMCAAGMRKEDMEQLWSARPDICIGQNDGFWVGRESVYSAYVGAYELALRKSQKEAENADGQVPPLGAGSMILHTSTTPLIEAAEDLKTAKGMFYSTGYVTTVEQGGNPSAKWVMQRYAVDFVQEEEEWKIWHLFIGVDYACKVSDRLYQTSPVPALNPEPLPLLEGVGFGTEFIPPYDINVPKLYSSEHGWCGYPPEPIPYSSFENTFSYGYEPFLESRKYSDPDYFPISS